MKHKKTNLRISHNKQLVLYLLNLGTIFCMTAFQILHFLSNSLLLWDNCLKHIKIICFLMSHYVFLFAPWGEKWDIIHQYASYKCGNRHLREALMIRICSKLYSLSSLTLFTNRKNFFFCLYLQPFLITQGPCLHMASTTQHFLAVLCFSASALWPGELKSLIIEHPIGKCAPSPCVCPALRMLANVNNPLSSIIPVLVGFIKDNRLIQSVIMCGEETCQEVTIGMTNTI